MKRGPLCGSPRKAARECAAEPADLAGRPLVPRVPSGSCVFVCVQLCFRCIWLQPLGEHGASCLPVCTAALGWVSWKLLVEPVVKCYLPGFEVVLHYLFSSLPAVLRAAQGAVTSRAWVRYGHGPPGVSETRAYRPD